MIVQVRTSVGTARCHVAAAAEPVATLVLGAGASGSVEATDLSLLPRQLPARGVTVVRVEQPWHVAGGKVLPRAEILDAGWRDVLAALRQSPEVADRPLFTGGRSNGSRVACRTAEPGVVAGVVCYAFPLHPPGRPEQSRLAELLAPSGVPRLVFQGERDAFGGADELRAAVQGAAVQGAAVQGAAIQGTHAVQVVPVPHADHSMRAAKASGITATVIAELLVLRTVAFCRSGRDPLE